MSERELRQNEIAAIRQALEVLQEPDVFIPSITLAGGRPTPERPMPRWVNVQTTYVPYPPQMLAAIKAALEARLAELASV